MWDELHKASGHRAPLTLDDKALDVVRAKLDLAFPVEVHMIPQERFSSSYGEQDGDKDQGYKVLGQYVGMTDRRAHHIHIDDTLPIYLANEALFHEMIHASQVERAGSYNNFRRWYRDAHDLGCMSGGCGCLSHECKTGYAKNHLEHAALDRAARLMRDKSVPKPFVHVNGFRPRQLVRKLWTPR